MRIRYSVNERSLTGRDLRGTRVPSRTSTSYRISFRAGSCSVMMKVIDVEQTLHLVRYGFKQRFRIQGGAQCAADFVEHAKLLRAARGLLNEIAILDGHADLMAERQQQAQFRRRKTAAIRGAQKQHAESLLFGLQADPDNGMQMLADRELPETPESFFAFQRRPGSVASEIAENDQSAQARDQVHQMIVESLFLRDRAEIFRQSDGDNRSRAFRIAVMQEKRSGRHAHNAQHALKRMRKHLLNFRADETGGGQVYVGKREHVVFDAALFLFVQSHDHQSRGE